MWSTGFEFQVDISCNMGVHQRVVLFGTVLDPDVISDDLQETES